MAGRPPGGRCPGQLRCDGGAGDELETITVRSPPAQHGPGRPGFGGLFGVLGMRFGPALGATKHCPEHCRRCAPPAWHPTKASVCWPFTNGSRNATTWLTAETQRLLGDLIGAPTASSADVPQHPEIWDDLCGWYHPRARRTDMQAWSVLGAGVQVLVRQVSRAAVIAESRRFQFQMAVTYRDGPMELFSCWLQSR